MSERDIFMAAREKTDPAARAAYLAEACAGDAALRKRVERLLCADAHPDSLLDAPAVAPPDMNQPNTPSSPANSQAGPISNKDSENETFPFLTPPGRPGSLGRLGRYEVLEVLGKGGFGIVFRTLDAVLMRVVAAKVLMPHIAATSLARKRFLREARSAAAVRHENNVQVYAVEEQPLPYLVMEFIPGETLQQRLNRVGPWRWPRCSALAGRSPRGWPPPTQPG